MTVLNPLPYTYLAKGKYWYFRCNGFQARIEAEPGSAAFKARYGELLRLSQREDVPVKPQPRRVVEDGWHVYFLGWQAGPIKIGIALDPVTRLYQAQTYVPYKLELWAVCDGGQSLERRYHKRFADHRLSGEWFERCPEIEAEIALLNPLPIIPTGESMRTVEKLRERRAVNAHGQGTAFADPLSQEAAALIEELVEALFDIRSRILCPVGPAPTLDEIEVIAQVALAKAHHPEEVLK